MNDFAFLDLSTTDLVIILVIILLLFGASRLPALSRSLGESARELRKGLTGDVNASEQKKKNDDNKDSDQQ